MIEPERIDTHAECRRGCPTPPLDVRHAASGQALIEFALVMPLLMVLVIGGTSLFIRNLYRDALDEAAEQAAWTAARSGGDATDIQQALEKAIPFVALEDLDVVVSSAGYHTEVQAVIGYRGTAISSLPFFNAPLPDAQASATNQQEASFALHFGGHRTASIPRAPQPEQLSRPPHPQQHGPAVWPTGPAQGLLGGAP